MNMAMTPEQKARFNQIIDSFAPEAREFVQSLKGKPATTKDNYGTVMSFLQSTFKLGEETPDSKKNKILAVLFLHAMVKAGYNSQTASQICQILFGSNMGFSSI